MRPIKILDIVEQLPDRDLLKAIAWKIPDDKDFPEGIKYAFAYIHKGKRILGYDNEKAKGHHKHIVDLQTGKEMQIKIEFKDMLSLFEKFKSEVYKLKDEIYGGKNESKKDTD